MEKVKSWWKRNVIGDATGSGDFSSNLDSAPDLSSHEDKPGLLSIPELPETLDTKALPDVAEFVEDNAPGFLLGLSAGIVTGVLRNMINRGDSGTSKK